MDLWKDDLIATSNRFDNEWNRMLLHCNCPSTNISPLFIISQIFYKPNDIHP